MSKLIRMKDKVSTIDDKQIGGLRGEVIFGIGRHDVHYTDPYGNPAVRSEFEKELFRSENIVPIGGYQFAFDKLFNIGLDQNTTLRVGDLNDEAPQMKIGVPRARYKSIHYNAETNIGGTENLPKNGGINISAMNFVFGFMIGDGGCREDNITPIAPDYKNRSLYRPIPFRMSNDGYPFPRGKYFGKSDLYSNNSNIITSYYVKKFDNPDPHIVHVWVTNRNGEMEIVDDTVFSSTSSAAIESYVEMNFSIDENDCRGFFTTTDSTPRVSELALVSGWYNAEEDDYESLRIFTKYTRPVIALAEGDSIEGIYRLYAR